MELCYIFLAHHPFAGFKKNPLTATQSPEGPSTAKVDVSVGPNQWSPASSSPKKRGMSEEEMKQHHQELEAKGKGVSPKKKKRGATPVSALKHGAVTDLAEVFTLSAERLVDVSAFVVDIHPSWERTFQSQHVTKT